MKIKTSKGLEDISTAVFYRRHPFIPSNLSDVDTSLKHQILKDCISTEVYHLGSMSTSDLLDFAEYDFSFEPTKKKFKDILQLNYLDEYSKNLMGYDTKDTSRLNEIMFPQISPNPISTSTQNKAPANNQDNSPIFPKNYEITTGFFGAVEVSHQTIALLKAAGEKTEGMLDGIYKIEVYNNHITENCQREYRTGPEASSVLKTETAFVEWDFLKQTDAISDVGITTINTTGPVITIYFGPQPENDENLKEDTRYQWYYADGLKYETEGSIKLDEREYQSLVHELSDEKIVWFLLSSDGTVREINLSYKAWTQCKNKHRNMNQYLLRNDEFFATKDVIDLFKTSFVIDDTEILYDSVSDTILGTKKIPYTDSGLPIFAKRKKRLENEENSMGWSPFINYNKGDEVKLYIDCQPSAAPINTDDIAMKTYVSTINNNKGNDPRFSIGWIKKNVNIKADYTKLFVSSSVIGAASINPSGLILLTKEVSGISFYIKLNTGYTVSTNPQLNGIDLIDQRDYHQTEINDDGEFSVIFVPAVPESNGLLDASKNNFLSFQFRNIGYNLIICVNCEERGIYEHLYISDWKGFNSEGSNDGDVLISNTRYGINSYFTTNSIEELFNSKTDLISVSSGDNIIVQLPRELPTLSISRLRYAESITQLESSSIVTKSTPITQNEQRNVTISPKNTFNYLFIDLEEKRFIVSVISYLGVEIDNIGGKVRLGESHVIKMRNEEGKTFNKITVKGKNTGETLVVTNPEKSVIYGDNIQIRFLMVEGNLEMTISNISDDLEFEILYK